MVCFFYAVCEGTLRLKLKLTIWLCSPITNMRDLSYTDTLQCIRGISDINSGEDPTKHSLDPYLDAKISNKTHKKKQ